MDTDQRPNPADEYDRLRPEYVRFTQKLEALLRELLRAKRVDAHLIESRTKEASSLREKLSQAAKSYTDPLNEVIDLAGIRVITYYQDDANAIAALIESEFIVDQENSVVHSATAAEFGYRSAHYVVKLSQSRASLLEWYGLSEYRAEIQVRTVLQHAWAAISHKLQYKREEDVPAVLKRKLFRLSALFELADDEFVSLRDASGNVKQQISEQLSIGNRKLPLDYVSLSKLLATSSTVAQFCEIAAEVGFDFDGVDGLPDEEDYQDTVSDLIQLASIAGISTLEAFERVMDDALPWAKAYLAAQFDGNINNGNSGWHVTPSFICELILIAAAIKHIRLGNLLRLGFNRGIGNRVFATATQFGAREAKFLATIPASSSSVQ